jgi:hypothetical protein
MFDPSCHLLSKKIEPGWNHIRTKVMTNLTEADVTAKSEEYQRHLLTIAAEINELTNNMKMKMMSMMFIKMPVKLQQ